MTQLLSRVVGGGLLLLALCGMAGLSSLARADNAKPAAPTTSGAGRALAQDDLLNMLGNMGYTVEVAKSTAGNPLNRVVLSRGGMDFTVYVSLSPSGQNVWLTVALADIPEPGKVPAENLYKLLVENRNRQPVNFDIHDAGKRLYMSRQLENKDITPARLREALDNFIGIAVETRPLWKQENWTAQPGPATTAAGATDRQPKGN